MHTNPEEKHMNDWENYKNKVQTNNPEIGKDLDEIEEVSTIVGAMIEQRLDPKLSPNDLINLTVLKHSAKNR